MHLRPYQIFVKFLTRLGYRVMDSAGFLIMVCASLLLSIAAAGMTFGWVFDRKDLTATSALLVGVSFVVVLTVLLLEKPEKFHRAKPERKDPPLFVSEQYAREIKIRMIQAYWIFSLCLLVAIVVREYITAGIIMTVMFAIASFYSLTMTRAQRGWFADNRYEALELLHFIISKSNSGGLPPGSRVSKHSEVVQPLTSPIIDAVRSRA